MYFVHKKGVKQNRGPLSKLVLLLSIIGFAGGMYLLVLVATPSLPFLYPMEEIDATKLPVPTADRIYIPKIGVSVEFKSGGEEVLDDSVWHRFPERGDPESGGNFILSAHRFEIGLTPAETRRKSPFYHIAKLEVGDQVIIDFNGKRYGYEITERTKVEPTQIEIEDPTDEHRLTLYTCTLQGHADGRDVFFAKMLGEVVDGSIIPLGDDVEASEEDDAPGELSETDSSAIEL